MCVFQFAIFRLVFFLFRKAFCDMYSIRLCARFTFYSGFLGGFHLSDADSKVN